MGVFGIESSSLVASVLLTTGMTFSRREYTVDSAKTPFLQNSFAVLDEIVKCWDWT